LDLKNDATAIAEYKRYHVKIWPEVKQSLLDAGVVEMEIYLMGTRMFMIMDVNDPFSLSAKAAMDLARYLTSSTVAGDVTGYYLAPGARKSVTVNAPISLFTPFVPYTWITPIIKQWPQIRTLLHANLQKAVLGKMKGGSDDDEKIGMDIIRRALEEPIRAIAYNAGAEGSIVVAKVRESKEKNYGYNALTDEFEDLVAAGVIDPTKVTRTALQNAASIAGLLLTTEAVVVEKKEDKPTAPSAPGAGMGGMY